MYIFKFVRISVGNLLFACKFTPSTFDTDISDAATIHGWMLSFYTSFSNFQFSAFQQRFQFLIEISKFVVSIYLLVLFFPHFIFYFYFLLFAIVFISFSNSYRICRCSQMPIWDVNVLLLMFYACWKKKTIQKVEKFNWKWN